MLHLSMSTESTRTYSSTQLAVKLRMASAQAVHELLLECGLIVECSSGERAQVGMKRCATPAGEQYAVPARLRSGIKYLRWTEDVIAVLRAARRKQVAAARKVLRGRPARPRAAKKEVTPEERAELRAWLAARMRERAAAAPLEGVPARTA